MQRKMTKVSFSRQLGSDKEMTRRTCEENTQQCDIHHAQSTNNRRHFQKQKKKSCWEKCCESLASEIMVSGSQRGWLPPAVASSHACTVLSPSAFLPIPPPMATPRDKATLSAERSGMPRFLSRMSCAFRLMRRLSTAFRFPPAATAWSCGRDRCSCCHPPEVHAGLPVITGRLIGCHVPKAWLPFPVMSDPPPDQAAL